MAAQTGSTADDTQSKIKALEFELSRKKPSKTLDIGFNGTSISTDPLGRILQISIFHPEHGMVVASPYKQFDGSKFRDSSYVRQYRARMLEMIKTGQPGFGFRFDCDVKHVAIELVNFNHAVIKFKIQERVVVELTLFIQENGELLQSFAVSSSAKSVVRVPYLWDLGISVNRASYGQLTEGGPIPIPDSENVLKLLNERRGFAIVNPNLGAHIEGQLEQNGKPLLLENSLDNRVFKESPVDARVSGVLEIHPHETKVINQRLRLFADIDVRDSFQKSSSIRPKTGSVWKHGDSEGMLIVHRNFGYIVGNCAIPISETDACILTDHVALPLGWNRDNYWQVRFLYDVYKNMDRLVQSESVHEYQSMIMKIAKGHLNWVFKVAQRPNGFWHRSYLTTGRPKDGPIFQLDQQCYPLLELCDFYQEFPGQHELCKSLLQERAVSDILGILEQQKDPIIGLCPTQETPADDAVDYPYHFSSQILLWYTICRTVDLAKSLNSISYLDISKLESFADELKRSTIQHFVTTRLQTKDEIFAYLTDGHGHYTFYHDANDIPTLFACEWKFLATRHEKQIWRNTMEFAFSSANEKAYVKGDTFEGLGSIHSPGPWTLGYFQELVYAQMARDSAREKDVWRKIQGVKSWDGVFSEAVDVQTGECTSKAWFSWPGSMIGSAILRSEKSKGYLEGTNNF